MHAWSRITERLSYARRISTLAPGRLGAAWLVLVATLMPLKGRLPRRLSGAAFPVWIAFAGGRRRVLIADWSELFVLGDVFLDEQYSVESATPPDTIVDLGANIGASALWFHLRFPQARILAFEPDPRSFARLRANTGDIAEVSVHQFAACRATGPVRFRVAEESWASSLAAEGNGPTISVSGLSLADLMDRFALTRIDLLKLDIEGAEYDVLEGFDRHEVLGEVIGELHALPGGAPHQRMTAALPGFTVEERGDGPDTLFHARRSG